MTGVEELRQEAPAQAARPAWKNAKTFGTAVGIEVGARDLRVVLLRARPAGVSVLGHLTVANFRDRPAKEWGSEFHHLLKQHGEKHLAARVLLPRRDVIVRQLFLPGVARKDLTAAISFQVDALHPYGDEDVAFGWSPAGAGSLLVGVIRQTTLDRYVSLFAEAGIPVEAFTFSASAIYAALRLYGQPPKDFLAFAEHENGEVEVYGESGGRSVFSAEFDFPAERALALARAELRLHDQSASSLEAMLPLSRTVATVPAMAYAAALSGVSRWTVSSANLLPPEKRIVRSRARYIPTIVLACLLFAAGGGLLFYRSVKDQQYLEQLRNEITAIQPRAMQADAIDRRTESHRERTRFLNEYRRRAQDEVDILMELSRLLPPPVWTNTVEILSDSVVIAGEADSAAPLLKILDSSPLFKNSAFMMGVARGPQQQGETFRIKTFRKARK